MAAAGGIGEDDWTDALDMDGAQVAVAGYRPHWRPASTSLLIRRVKRGKLTAGLHGLAVPRPSEKALRDLRRRLGPVPLKALFEVVAGPLAPPHMPGVSFAGLRTVAFDGLNSLKVPDTDRNRSWIGRIRYRAGFAGYPTLRLMALAETGTRSLLGAVLGSAADRDEAHLARRLLHLLRPGMLLLPDRAFDANAFLAEVHATGAMVLARARCARNPRVAAHLPDGSYLSAWTA